MTSNIFLNQINHLKCWVFNVGFPSQGTNHKNGLKLDNDLKNAIVTDVLYFLNYGMSLFNNWLIDYVNWMQKYIGTLNKHHLEQLQQISFYKLILINQL